MSRNNKSKHSLADMIKERAQRPDFLPKSFLEDNTRLAEETLPRDGASASPSSQEPAHPRAYQIPAKTPDPQMSAESTGTGARASARPRAYAQAVLNQLDSLPLGSHDPVQQGPETSTAATSVSPYRRDLKRVATYLLDPAKDQLRVLTFNERTSEEDLLREAIDLLFEQRGLPQIAFAGAPSRKSRQH